MGRESKRERDGKREGERWMGREGERDGWGERWMGRERGEWMGIERWMGRKWWREKWNTEAHIFALYICTHTVISLPTPTAFKIQLLTYS